MTAETTENDLLNKSSTEAGQLESNPLHELLQEITTMPDIDQEKVQAALNKLKSGNLEILGTDEQRLTSAQRIAQKIIDESSGTL